MLTAMGQTMDLQSSPGDGERPDLDLFTMEKYSSIIKHKTAYYSFYLPVALALNMVNLYWSSIDKSNEVNRFLRVLNVEILKNSEMFP